MDAGWVAMSENVKDKDADKAKDQEQELDEGLEGTFPASDPPASTQPGDGKPEPDEKKGSRSR